MIANSAHAGALGPWRDDPLVAIDRASPIDALLDESAPQCADLTRSMVAFADRPDLYTLVNPQTAWGSPYIVDLLTAAAEEMAILLPDADPILIGDVSHKGGGPLPPHISHQLGIDADVGLFMTGETQPTVAFQMLGPSNLDMEASWLLIKSLLDSGRIDFILLDPGLIDMFRDWTVENGRLTKAEADRIMPREGTERLWEMHGILRAARNHRDHMHVRVLCANGGAAEE